MKIETILVITLLIYQSYGDVCSDVTDISLCLSTSNFCYIVEANVPYLSAENPEIGVILDEVNDKCMSLNFYTRCDQLITKESCSLGSCIWDPLAFECYEWDSAPCQSYPTKICQWNSLCELVNQTQTLSLATNYTLMNSVDLNQLDGRNNGTWLYEFGQIIQIQETTTDSQTYLFTKCQLKNQCDQIQIPSLDQAVFICHTSELGCYYDTSSNRCQTISHLTACEDIKWQQRCESGAAPCLWQNNKCLQFDEVDSCTFLSAGKCLNNENCFIEGSSCKTYSGCSDSLTKPGCDSSPYYCYYNDYEQKCKPLIYTNVDCQTLGYKNCVIFEPKGKCIWQGTPEEGFCSEILQDFHCQQFEKINCPGDETKTEARGCIWSENLQLCIWDYQTYTCSSRTMESCDKGVGQDANNCYYDIVLNECTPIQPNTQCEFLGYYACNFPIIQTQNLCQWSIQRELCISIYDFNCEDVTLEVCPLKEKCFKNGNKCATRRQCSDNLQITDCWDDQSQYCYYDYDERVCRRVTVQSPCNQIFREGSCNQAICAWKNNQCLSLEDVSCNELTIQNCKYSSLCQYYNQACIPLDQCGLNDGRYDACVMDPHHCIYDATTNKCTQIDGSSDCNKIYGADNCNFAACVLQPDQTKQLKCIEYEQADCQILKKEYCNFGQCTWNITLCVQYPYVIKNATIIDNTTKPTTTPTTPNEEEEKVNFYQLSFGISTLLILIQ